MIWHFCCKENQITLEKIQKRALRIVLNDYISNYTDLLQNVNLPALYIARLRVMVLEIYKMTHGMTPTFLENIIMMKDTSYELRDQSKAVQPKVRNKQYCSNSFRYEGARLWNKLPSNIKYANGISEFRYLLEKWQGPVCTCGYCILCIIKSLYA